MHSASNLKVAARKLTPQDGGSDNARGNSPGTTVNHFDRVPASLFTRDSQTNRPALTIPLPKPETQQYPAFDDPGVQTGPFTLQYVAGHDNIKMAMRDVHPQANAVEKLFVRRGSLGRRQASRRSL